MFPPTSGGKMNWKYHRPQDVHKEHLHTPLPFPFTFPHSPFILLSFAGTPDLGWTLNPQPDLYEQHKKQCHGTGFTPVKKQMSFFPELARLAVLSVLLPCQQERHRKKSWHILVCPCKLMCRSFPPHVSPGHTSSQQW